MLGFVESPVLGFIVDSLLFCVAVVDCTFGVDMLLHNRTSDG